MGGFVVGEVVVVPFPFSDLRRAKRRPALILAMAERGNLILCQITSNSYASKRAIRIGSKDFARGKLPVESYARPDKIFTAEPSLVVDSAGKLKKAKMRVILKEVSDLFEGT